MSGQEEASLEAPPEGWKGIEAILADISEDFYCAGWMHNTEYAVWQMMEYGGRWGMGDACDIPEQLGALRSLSRRLGVWVEWTDANDYPIEPVPLDRWVTQYEAWRKANGYV